MRAIASQLSIGELIVKLPCISQSIANYRCKNDSLFVVFSCFTLNSTQNDTISTVHATAGADQMTIEYFSHEGYYAMTYFCFGLTPFAPSFKIGFHRLVVLRTRWWRSQCKFHAIYHQLDYRTLVAIMKLKLEHR